MNTAKKQFLLLVILILSFSACMNPLYDLSNEEKEIGREVKIKFDEYLNKLEHQDLTNIQEFYSESEKFRWTEGRGINTIQTENDFDSATDLAKFINGNYDENALTTIKITCPKSVKVTDESHARVFMSYKQVMKDANGIKTKYQGHLMIDMQKEDGEWKFLFGDDQRIELNSN